MNQANRWISRAAMFALPVALLALSGCSGGNVRSDVSSAAIAEHHFNTTIEAYKGDQFLLDGALLSPLDMGSHFAYLKDQGKLPKSVLLVSSDASKIHKKQRQYMARLSIDYGFSVYYADKDQLVLIDPIEKNARPLESGSTPLPNRSGNEGQTAHDSTYGDVQQQEQQQQDQQQY